MKKYIVYVRNTWENNKNNWVQYAIFDNFNEAEKCQLNILNNFYELTAKIIVD